MRVGKSLATPPIGRSIDHLAAHFASKAQILLGLTCARDIFQSVEKARDRVRHEMKRPLPRCYMARKDIWGLVVVGCLVRALNMQNGNRGKAHLPLAIVRLPTSYIYDVRGEDMGEPTVITMFRSK